MGILSWVILGAIAGFLGYTFAGGEGRGCLLNMLLGIAGAVVGGMLFRFFGGTGITGLNPYSMLVATVGAVVLIVLSRMFSGK